MKSIKLLVILLASVITASCATQKSAPIPKTNKSILGTWEGCDGRIIEFKKEEDKIVGRCIVLGGLGAYGFSKNEVGYEVKKEGTNTYKGRVKWRTTGQKDPYWRNVEITIDGDNYSDRGSDQCGKEMTRVASGNNP